MNYREERDTMGKVLVPENAYYGAQTQRAVQNFPVSDLRMPVVFIRSLALIKKCAARVNGELGILPGHLVHPIVQSASEIIDGKFRDQFPVDIFQTGSATSSNMNVNEVIASRANELITGKIGGRYPVHPNDHVNLGQSSNDVIPSAMHISASILIRDKLLPALGKLRKTLQNKAKEFRGVVKTGRTHLQDAIPVALGDEFSGYSWQVKHGIERIKRAAEGLLELTLGGTAVGTGAGSHPEFAKKTIALISEETGFDFRETGNHFGAQGSQDTAVEVSGSLKTLATGLIKIANDLRLLSSGPRCGLGEIILPEIQPGSSMMPGKVNPVIPEMVIQVGSQVIGNDLVVSLAGSGGNLELNTMLPVMIHNLLQSIQLLASCSELFAEKCVSGIKANRKRCAEMVENSLALATYLVPFLGYDKAAEISKKAYYSNRTIFEVIRHEKLLTERDLKELREMIFSKT